MLIMKKKREKMLVEKYAWADGVKLTVINVKIVMLRKTDLLNAQKNPSAQRNARMDVVIVLYAIWTSIKN